MFKLLFSMLTVGIAFMSAPLIDTPVMTEYGDCVEKYRSEWGVPCSQCPNYQDSYVVHLKNTCSEAIDVMVCVQEADRTWRKFNHSSVAPRDSMRAYACNGTGKYLSWARKAGDEFTVFPTVEEVNRTYRE